MKKYFKRSSSLLGSHLVAVLICVLASVPIISLVKSDLVLTMIMMLIYLSSIYSAGWNVGYKDARKISGIMPDLPGAVKTVLIYTVVPFLLLICRVVAYHMCIADGQTMTGFLRTTEILYRLYNFYFTGLMSGGALWVYAIPLLIPVIVYPAGYAVGLKRFSLIDKYLGKIIYQQKKKKSK